MEPVRTCVGCRSRADRSELLRVVMRDHKLITDERAVLPGRGAWVHPNEACVGTAIARNAFTRALRASGALDASDLRDRLNSYGNKVNGSK